MASYAVALNERGTHQTLVASTVDTVTFTRTTSAAGTAIEVLNRDGSAEIYFTFDGSAPTVGGNNTFVLPAVVGASLTRADGSTVVKLISVGTPAYSVFLGAP